VPYLLSPKYFDQTRQYIQVTVDHHGINTKNNKIVEIN